MDKQEHKMTKRQQKSIQTQKNILSAALALMKRDSFESITIEQICKAAGSSIGTFYYYFKSKDELYISLFKEMDVDIFGEFKIEENSQNAVEILTGFFTELAHLLTEFGWHMVRQNFHAHDAVFYDKGQNLRQALRGIIRLGQSRNELDTSMDEEDMADYLLTMARGTVYDWSANSGNYDLTKLMTKYMARILTSIKKG